VHALAIDPAEGRYLLAGGQDKALAIFDTASTGHHQPNGDKTKCKAVCKISAGAVGGHKYTIETVQWYPFDTGVFSTSGMDGSLKVWDTNALQVVVDFANLPGGKVYDHAMSPIAGHGLIAVGTKHNRVKLCDPSSGSSTHELAGHKSDVLAVAWSPASEYLLATGGRDSRVILWDIRTAGPLHVLDQHNGGQAGASSFVVTSHNGEVNGLSFLPNGLHLVTTGRDHRLRLWNADTGKNELKHYPRIDNVYQKKIKLGVSAMTKQPLLFCPSRYLTLILIRTLTLTLTHTLTLTLTRTLTLNPPSYSPP
jgi:DNA excision repair protein ERCC-8